MRAVGPRVEPLTLAGLSRPAPSGAMAEEDVSVPTDLASLVDAMIQARDTTGLPAPHRPWLEPLPELITLDQVGGAGQTGQAGGAERRAQGHDGGTAARPGPVGGPAVGGPGPAEGPGPVGGPAAGPGGGRRRTPGVESGFLPPLTIGMEDVPAEQAQRPMTWDYTHAGHLGVAGAPRSGRSALLRTLAAGIARTASPADVHLYGLDAGSGALLPLVSLPHTGAVVTRDQRDRVRRLLNMLGTEVSRRQQKLAMEAHSSLAEQRAAAPEGERLPYLVLMLDRWDGFAAVFENIDSGKMLDSMETLMREGAAVGVRVVVTGDRTTFRGRTGMLLEDRLLLRMPSADSFDLVGMRARDVPASMPPGRAFRSGPHPREVHVALLDEDPSGTVQTAAFYRECQAAGERWGTLPRSLRPARVDELPLVISARDALELGPARRPGSLALGVGGDTLAVRSVEMEDVGNGVLVTGPRRSGRSTALAFALDTALRDGARAALVLPRRSPLTAWAGHPGVLGVLDASATEKDLAVLLGDDPTSTLVVLDDLDVLGKDHRLALALDKHVLACRDSTGGVLVACNLDEAYGLGRNLLTTVRKNRTGILLAPRAASEGDVFSARLPRSVAVPVPVGRGVLITASGWSWIQVPHTTGPGEAARPGPGETAEPEGTAPTEPRPFTTTAPGPGPGPERTV